MEWISSNGATIAAFLSVVAASFSAWATFRGPIMAAHVAESLRGQSGREENIAQMRRFIFFTLMQQRATLASEAAVQAFNAIDVVFHDCQQVREAWADLYHYFGGGAMTPQSTDDKTRELLRQMALALGISDVLRRDDLSRVYFPTRLMEEDKIKQMQTLATKSALESQLKAPMANTAPTDSLT